MSVCLQEDEGRAESPGVTCESMNSNMSMGHPLNFNERASPSLTECDSESRREEALETDCKTDEGRTSGCVSLNCGFDVASHWDQSGSSGVQGGKRSTTTPALQKPSQTGPAGVNDGLQEVSHQYKISLSSRCEHVTEGTDGTGSGTLLNRIYTELHITEGQSEEVNTQHEVRQLETTSKMETLHDAPIRCHDIFRVLPDQQGEDIFKVSPDQQREDVSKVLADQQRPIRLVLTNGVAGVGKTFSVQKFSLDWAEGLENQDVSLLVLLSFRELVLFIFDGLDESRLSLDFNNRKSKGNIMFYQEDLEQCGLDVTEASVNSGLCTEIFRGESVIFQKTVYCFVHLSVQEFLAAVYMFHCYTNKDNKTLETFLGTPWGRLHSGDPSVDMFLRKAIDQSLTSSNGHLDLFVRFLHGLSLESNQRLLGVLLGRTENSPESIRRSIDNLKEIRTHNIPPDRSINLFHCLTEMKDHSVHQEIQEFLKSEDRSEAKLCEIHCSAPAYMLPMSKEVVGELDMKATRTSEEGGDRLIPAVRKCREVHCMLPHCCPPETDCEVLALTLKSSPSPAGPESPNSRPEILRLRFCSWPAAESFRPWFWIRTPPIWSGVMLLSARPDSPQCSLATLISAVNQVVMF
ncbi:uncharacterized protein LOC111661045 [Seriola lalandi dorsalis]|uniref:uncharacterized protein LOC111661045 n=1 Tax=Seriola lalandi dorsalis TaxID=1841481 RepID=UPI000C6FB03E|nr:uncharacterized protein LOC111661045 [Seriola lalandi dorsalis]